MVRQGTALTTIPDRSCGVWQYPSPSKQSGLLGDATEPDGTRAASEYVKDYLVPALWTQDVSVQ